MANGKNVNSNVLESPDEQLKTKRAKKATQNAAARANAHSGNRPVLNHQKPQPIRWQTPLLGAVRDPKIVAGEKAAAETKAKHVAKEVEFRNLQATMAAHSPNIVDLRSGSIALKIASRTLDLFPAVVTDVQATGRRRLEEAVFQARKELKLDDPRFDKAAKLGADRVLFALNRARYQINNDLKMSVPR